MNKLFAKKIGMTRVFSGKGFVPVSVLKIHETIVVQIKTVEKDGYNAIVVAYGDCTEKKITNHKKQFFKKINISPKKYFSEIKTDNIASFKVGDVLSLYPSEGDLVNVSGYTIGKGFQGVIKRHGFGGLRASHGVSISHRSHGSTGQRQDPGKVFKGKKMAGHMGAKKATVKNLKLIKFDEAKKYVLLLGAVPGAKNTSVELYFSKSS